MIWTISKTCFSSNFLFLIVLWDQNQVNSSNKIFYQSIFWTGFWGWLLTFSWALRWILWAVSEAHSEPSQTYKMRLFAKKPFSKKPKNVYHFGNKLHLRCLIGFCMCLRVSGPFHKDCFMSSFNWALELGWNHEKEKNKTRKGNRQIMF